MVRIALISDIHFGKDARAKEFSLPDDSPNGHEEYAPSLSEGAICKMKEMKVEYLFVAGDLTSVGSPAEYHFCEKKIMEIAEKSGIPREHIIWCVGNHDNDWQISRLYDAYEGAEAKVLEISREKYRKMATSVASANMSIFPSYICEGPLPMTGIYMDEKIVTFILNSSTWCVHGKSIDHGKLTNEQLKWFEEKALEYANDPKWKIVLMHHHPFNYPYPVPGLDVSQLEEGSEFCKIAGKYGINLVIHGHRHHPQCKTTKENEWKAPISFVCGGSFSVNESERKNGDIPNTFHIIELLEEVGDLKLYTYEYSIGGGWRNAVGYRDVVPLDYMMRLGKNFSKEEIEEALRKLLKLANNESFVRWEQLETPFLYMSSEYMSDLIKNSKFFSGFDVKVHPQEGLFMRKK